MAHVQFVHPVRAHGSVVYKRPQRLRCTLLTLPPVPLNL